ncbi:E3 ubiquitin-protein ligase KEG-like [Pygocentrus nattereri]|uniref:E3 ubiquitin-protein ligase KEG-like n=1 Tax=Pygocentrus nattereri TaxID=42514 RepID=UPI000814A7D1|nr:E3 ubiquitin-protein ligase KEG-like [Pygocentrus nattereri]
MERERPVIINSRSRCYKVTRVCLGLMYVLLLPAITAMHVTLESDQSQANANKMMKEDQLEHLKTSYEKLKTERDQLQASYNNLATERDQLQDKVKEITKEKDKLEAHFILTRILLDRLQKEKDGLQKSFTDPGNFKVGDRVRVKASVTTPKYKWGSASHSSVGVVTEVGDETMMVDFPEHKSWKAAISEMELAPSRDSGCIRVGDRVKVKASVSSPKHGWGDVTSKSVGVVTALDGESLTIEFPEHKSWKGLVSEMELASSADSGYFRVGDQVRVKASVNTPKYEWGDASHKSVGVITAINGEKMTVDFPEHKSWNGLVSEMELAPSADQGYFRIGDRVRVKPSVNTPKYEWGRASHKSVGVVKAINGESMTVDFPEHESWKAAVSEMELAPSADLGQFRVGDRVRVKASVSSPKHEWGGVSHSSVGVVKALDGERMTVDFPEQKSWTAAASEMELAPKAEIFRVGDRVRVKASVSTPKYKWGGASHNSVGVVSEIDGESLTVHFPEHASWKGIVSEMELLPSAYSEFCNFKPGDKVRVKASVEKPKYQWGSVSHKSVGTIKALKMVVDFPEHSDWSADASDMELAP